MVVAHDGLLPRLSIDGSRERLLREPRWPRSGARDDEMPIVGDEVRTQEVEAVYVPVKPTWSYNASSRVTGGM